MNQEKIGKFICSCRKERKMTQAELAERIGVTEKSISNWENGRNMPDLGLFKPLCEILDISINDLLSGEKIKSEDYQEKLEENIVSTIDYTNKKVNDKNYYIAWIFIIFGLLIIITAMGLFPSESSWGSIYSTFGVLVTFVGVNKLIKKMSTIKRIFLSIGYLLIFILALMAIDYLSVIYNRQSPRFSYLKISGDRMTVYKTAFYNVYRINVGSKNEYYIVDSKKTYTEDTVPKTPFNRNISGIDNIIKYKSAYIGNNSNTGKLIDNLPLKEYGYVFKIDSTKFRLEINYHITDWYIDEDNYLKKCLVYNSVSIFSLIENVELITYNFSGKSYSVTRKQVIESYPNYSEIIKNGIDKDNFNKYLENRLYDEEFIDDIFSIFFQSVYN